MPTSGTLHIDLVYFLRDCNPSTRLFFSIFPVGGDKFSLKTKKNWAADCNLYHFYYHYKFSTIHDVPNSYGMPVNKLFLAESHSDAQKSPLFHFLSLNNDHIFTQIGSDDLTRSINALLLCQKHYMSNEAQILLFHTTIL